MNARVATTLGLVRVALHVVTGVTILSLAFPFADVARQQRFVRWWAGRLLAICRMRLRIVGAQGVTVYDPTASRRGGARVIDDALRPGGIGAMLVLNHISWADIFVVDAVRPARFVARAEIAKWPLLGYMTARTGTVFIERGKRHAVRDANQRVAKALTDGALLAMFPEGMTGEGDRLLPFHANLLQPAIDTGVPIVVGGLRYLDLRGRPTKATSYAGDITLLQSLVRILGAGPVIAELHLIEAIVGAGLTRHQVAQRARALIAQRLGFDDEGGEARDAMASVYAAPARTPFRRGAGPAGREPGTELDPRDELL